MANETYAAMVKAQAIHDARVFLGFADGNRWFMSDSTVYAYLIVEE